jgi:hypothetical protein
MELYRERQTNKEKTTYMLISHILERNSFAEIQYITIRLYKNKNATGKSGVAEDPPGSVEIVDYSVNDLLQLEDWIKEKSDNDWMVSMTSIWKNEKQEKFYLPVMDFSIEISDESEQLVRERLKGVLDLYPQFGRGSLVQTNNSYHFVGDTLIVQKDWIAFCANMILLKHSRETRDIADVRFIGHSLVRGYTCVRISEKEGILPFVLGEGL